MGVNPTNAELDEMTKETGGMSGKMDFNQFVTIMCNKMRQEDSEEDLINAFQVFDKEQTGKISAVELKHVMTTLGEILTDQEVDEMIRNGDAGSDGMIDYKAFAKKMFSK
jgi:calmodulin